MFATKSPRNSRHGFLESSWKLRVRITFILRKPDKSIRISLDARGLNQLLVNDRFPLPHMTTVFNTIGNKIATGKSCSISSLDLSRAYWQIRVYDDDAFKLAFSHNGQHYQANRMLYGTATAPSAFSRIMTKIMNHPSIILYLDDLICIDSSFAEHLTTLQNQKRICQRTDTSTLSDWFKVTAYD
jgi:hypothetical protein